MNKRKFAGSIIAAVSALSLCSVPYVSAFEAPSDIELYIGSIELDTDEISGGMTVDVPLIMENNPGFVSVSFIIQLDSRLQFEDMNAVSTSADGFGNISISTRNGWENVIEVNGFARDVFKFEGNGQIAELHIVIPEGTQAGVYPIDILAQYDNRETSIITENSAKARFGSECFSVLESGGITVNAPYIPPPPPPPAEPQQPPDNNVPVNQPQQNNEPASQAETKETTAVATAVLTTKVTASATNTTKKATERPTSSSAVTTTETTSAAEITSTSAASSSTTNVKSENDKEKSNSRMLIPIIAATVAVIAAAIGIVVKKKGVNK